MPEVVYIHSLPFQKRCKITNKLKQDGHTIAFSLSKKVTLFLSTERVLQTGDAKVQQAKQLNILVQSLEQWETTSIQPTPTDASLDNNISSLQQYNPVAQLQLGSSSSNYDGAMISNVNNNKKVASVTMVIPGGGSRKGGYTVAIVGINFLPSSLFLIRFDSPAYSSASPHYYDSTILCSDIEFHSETSIICNIPTCNMAPGTVRVSASNDGATFGIGVDFNFYDEASTLHRVSTDRKLTIIRSQLQNLRRAIINIQEMELELRKQIDGLSEEERQILAREQLQLTANSLAASTQSAASNNLPLSLSNSTSISDSINITPPSSSTTAANDRELRIFFSSPFRDMQAERDVFMFQVKRVMPKLRKLCNERDVVLRYVDLRWGVTGPQSEQAAMLLMCLRELDSCSLFIGAYGERYGWCIGQEGATKKRDSLLKRSFDTAAQEYEWVNKFRDKSVTELEMRMILAKIQNDTTNSLGAWFYFRDPYFVEEIPQKQRSTYRSEGATSLKKLQKLKSDIKSCNQVACASYKRPEHLAEVLYEDLRDKINRLYPEGIMLSTLNREKFMHTTNSRALQRTYLANEELYLKLDQFVASDLEIPLVVVGESGLGKSALLANWQKRVDDHHPEFIVMSHWIGCTPLSADYQFMIWRIMAQLQDIMQLTNEDLLIPQEFEAEQAMDLVNKFPTWLETVMTIENANNRTLVLIIDGVNKLNEKQNAKELIWFPRTFPANVKVVLSTIPESKTLKVLEKRDSDTMIIEPLNEGQRKSFIRLHLQHAGKKLSEAQELTIAKTAQAANPRYLQTLLEDICISAVHEDLDIRISKNLQSKNAAELYELVLERLEKDYDPKKKDVVRHFLTFIWGARAGLNLSNELQPLLESLSISEQEWDGVFLALGDLLTSSSGSLNFANGDLRKAVEARYLSEPQLKTELHNNLASFFHASWQSDVRSVVGVNTRLVEELPYQYEMCGAIEKLHTVISDLQAFDILFDDVHKFDLYRYWRKVEKVTANSHSTYIDLLARGQIPSGIVRADLTLRIAEFLKDMAWYTEATAVYNMARDLYENSSQRLQVAKVDISLANLFHAQGKASEAESKLKSSLTNYEKELGPEHGEVGKTLERLGVVYYNTNEISKARECFDRALDICTTQFGSDHPITADVVYDIGCLFLQERDQLHALENAESWIKKALDSKVMHLGDWHPEVARMLNRLGSIYIELDQFNDAEDAFQQALLIREEKLGASHSRVAQTLKHMISLYEMQELYEQALEHAERALEITRKIFGVYHKHSAAILLRISDLQIELKQKDKALESLQEVERIREHILQKEREDKNRKGRSAAPGSVKEIINCLLSPPPPPPPPLPLNRTTTTTTTTSSSSSSAKFPPPPPKFFGSGPPPPPPMENLPPPSAIKLVNLPEHGALLNSIRGFAKQKLHKQKQTDWKNDAFEMAKAMVGAKQKRLAFQVKKGKSRKKKQPTKPVLHFLK